MKIYIAGPMRGHRNENREAFYKAEGMLMERYPSAGIFNPATIEGDLPQGSPQLEYAKRDIPELLTSTHIFLLPGWEDSIGARAEASVATWIKLEFIAEDESWVPEFPLASDCLDLE